ncbi:MAG: cysteine desulfurase [Nitrospiraceae bacterium]|nr:cysteine desulfurase [Nitrospiraceae bacterium]
MTQIYLDNIATNPLDSRVFDAMLPYLKENFGNPMSFYELGIKAKEAVENARSQTAGLINSKPQEIVFTSSGAEANNFALRGIAHARQNEGKHIIVSRIEHNSIINPARFLEKMGFTVTYLPVDKYGMVDPDNVKESITKETKLISLIYASSEVGTIEPIKEIAAIAKQNSITFHTDAVAAAGNLPIDVNELGIDLLSMSAHQFYGPKGAGALYVREGTRIVPLIYGGVQENGKRAGTENVPAIVGMGMAAELAKKEMSARTDHMKKLAKKLFKGIMSIDNVIFTGHPDKRLHGHASFCIEFIEGEAMLLLLGAKGIYAASGSACSSKALKSSPVLLAMGISSSIAQGSIIFTIGKDNKEEEIDYLIAEFPQIIKRLRDISPYNKKWGIEGEGGECIVKK